MTRLTVAVLALAAFVPGQDPAPATPADREIADHFASLVSATHWRERNAARDALATCGEKALPTLITGSAHNSKDVRRACHHVLRANFATDQRAIDAIVAGLDDDDQRIRYESAFHLGPSGALRAVDALRTLVADEKTGERTRYAAAKSLGELRVKDVTVTLWQGLGSDDAYTRYLSNLGIKGLCGKDLTEFGYGSPWEGAFVSGGAVGRRKGAPIEKAKNRVARWTAIVAFTEWLKTDKPDLFAELAEKLW